MINVTLYTRKNCHLCDVAKADLDALRPDHPHTLFLIDIDEDESLRQAYGDKVPVIEVGPYRKEAPFSRQDLIITLKAAQDRVGQLEKIGDARYQKQKTRARTLTRADRLSLWFTGHYMLVFNLLVFLYVGIPFLAPVFMNAGITGPARVIYTGYSAVCHQFAFRSWFLFGEQAAYPRAAAQVDGVLTYGQATGLDEADVFQARSYLGDEDDWIQGRVLRAGCGNLRRHPDFWAGFCPDRPAAAYLTLVFLDLIGDCAHRAGWRQPTIEPAAAEPLGLQRKYTLSANPDRIPVSGFQQPGLGIPRLRKRCGIPVKSSVPSLPGSGKI